jgi:muconolactone delta-isomerase
MKFLVLYKPKSGAPPMDNPLAIFQAAKAYMNAEAASGMIDIGYAIPMNSGFSISNAESHEELWERLAAYPLAPYSDIQIFPLLNADHYFDKTIEGIQQMMGG